MTEQSGFQVGDQVRLKSGGPVMTVSGPEEFIGVPCQWFSGKKLEGGRFAAASLERVDAEKKS